MASKVGKTPGKYLSPKGMPVFAAGILSILEMQWNAVLGDHRHRASPPAVRR